MKKLTIILLFLQVFLSTSLNANELFLSLERVVRYSNFIGAITVKKISKCESGTILIAEVIEPIKGTMENVRLLVKSEKLDYIANIKDYFVFARQSKSDNKYITTCKVDFVLPKYQQNIFPMLKGIYDEDVIYTNRFSPFSLNEYGVYVPSDLIKYTVYWNDSLHVAIDYKELKKQTKNMLQKN